MVHPTMYATARGKATSARGGGGARASARHNNLSDANLVDHPSVRRDARERPTATASA